MPGVDVLGPSTNALFGQVYRTMDPTTVRPYFLEENAGIQREVRPGMSVGFSYFHRGWHDLFGSYNPALESATGVPVPGAFTPVSYADPCYNNPTCGGVAPQTITLYAINHALIGQGFIHDHTSPINKR